MAEGFGHDLNDLGGHPWRRRHGGRHLAPLGAGERAAEQSFWRSLGTAEQEALEDLATEVSFPSGAVLCREGDDTSDVFLIKSGWVKISTEIGGSEQIIAVRGAGDIVGERAVRSMDPRSATVTALNQVQARVLPAGGFTEFLENHPAAVESVKHLDEERDAEDRLRREALDPARTERYLAELILRLAGRIGWEHQDDSAVIALPMSVAALASWANADPGAVDRYLRSWHRRGIVRDDRDAGNLVIVLARLKLFYERDLLPAGSSPYGRPLWQAFTDGVGGTFDLFGVTRRTRRAVPALADEAHALCLILGLVPEGENGGGEGAG